MLEDELGQGQIIFLIQGIKVVIPLLQWKFLSVQDCILSIKSCIHSFSKASITFIILSIV